MLVKVTFEAIETGEKPHYHKATYEGLMSLESMQELQGLVVGGMVEKGNEKAGLSSGKKK